MKNYKKKSVPTAIAIGTDSKNPMNKIGKGIHIPLAFTAYQKSPLMSMDNAKHGHQERGDANNRNTQEKCFA